MAQMSKPNPDGLFDAFTAEILRQQGFTVHEDPRSVYDPQQLYTALNRYATDWSKFEHLDEHLEFGFRKAYKIFARPKSWSKLKVLSDEQVATKALKLEKSSGLPLMTSKAASLTYSFDRERQVRMKRKAPNPCVAYKRTQAGNKTRLVWGYPLEMTIMEARFARPLIERFLGADTPMAFGKSKIELGARLHRYFRDQPGTTVCLDYSKYDTTLSCVMLKEAFRILSTWFTEEDLEHFGWDIVVTYFITTPIVMPDGHLYVGKHHGVPSGSYFTQLVDSVCNVAISYALAHKFNFRFRPEALYVMGDDVIMQVSSKVTHDTLRQWAQYLNSEFSLQLHDDEKTVLGRVHFLGAFWDKGKPDADIQELANKAAQPETFRDFGGQPREGAVGVLRSYASQYLSAHRFLPTGIRLSGRLKDMPPGNGVPEDKHLSGSDRYLREEMNLLGRGHSSAEIPSIVVRFLR
jgi:hypothetical protein